MKGFLKSKGISEKVANEFGITYKNNTMYFPILNSKGKLLYTKYREIDKHMMMPAGSKIALYGIHKIKKGDTVVIVEGETDMLALWSVGIKAITSTGGVMSFKKEWAMELLKWDIDIYICFDNDKAGHDGMARIWEYLPFSKYIFLKDYNDVSDFIAAGNDFKPYLAPNGYSDIPTGFVSHLGKVFDVPDVPKVKKYNREFSQDLQERIKQAKAIPFNELVPMRGTKFRCPFHDDKVPSMSWWVKENTVKCFSGNCTPKPEDTIGFVMRVMGYTFKQALNHLTKK